MFLITFLIFPYTCNFRKLQITTKTFIFLYILLFFWKKIGKWMTMCLVVITQAKLQRHVWVFMSGLKWENGTKMVPFVPLLFCESSMSLKENLDTKKMNVNISFLTNIKCWTVLIDEIFSDTWVEQWPNFQLTAT